MAFGTGTHATTRLCLNGLAGLELHDQRVLDLGAGSGILGLFAALCGAARVVMVEPDPVAVDAIAHNAKQNHLEDRIVVVPGTLANLNPERFDVLCLNLIWEIIAAEWTRVQRYVAQTGSTLLLSGLLAERQDDVKRLVRQTGQRVLAMEESEGWLLVTVRHDSSRA
jgi:ribosomal protein L11 methyltransferase